MLSKMKKVSSGYRAGLRIFNTSKKCRGLPAPPQHMTGTVTAFLCTLLMSLNRNHFSSHLYQLNL